MALAKVNAFLSSPKFVTKMIVTGGLFMMGDIMSQNVEISMRKKKNHVQKYDIGRTARRALFGACIATPMLHAWFGKILPALFPKVTTPQVLGKVLLDQTMMAPTFITTFFFCSTVMEGGSVEEGKSMVKGHLWGALLMNWRVWPLAQLTNFFLFPVHMHLHFANFIAMFWSAYLSYLQASRQLETAAKIAEPRLE
mmetsp:Transcript_49913/g.57284  ORF Transcript_49913/g.57284 Transcript_49913/m.57284 type:complete len:196 (+) Transcript_49913:75-662(+)|eukprot:CAMPEP_0115009988 /NCGR_PEP_ID=MMETSP0216-20121206/23000_1 /TAXON_ID=223996 /ORGANISM="Protocruzia adherens, Strain Boccale" /LENGTH=195 /DNA_ID=CAMNT_0002378021 /DNA_START=53 /DNA_END=640 /DNA_ORIENTATION=+